MAVRDLVVRWVLSCGASAALLTFHFAGPWPAMVLVVLTAVAASIVYRIEPPRIDLDGSPWPDDTADRERSASRGLDQ